MKKRRSRLRKFAVSTYMKRIFETFMRLWRGTGRRVRVGAVVVLAALLGALGLLATQSAQAADTSTTSPSGNVTFDLTRTRTGSGFGTSSQCFINSKNGYSPGDDSASDDYVCNNDSVAFGIKWLYKGSDTDETFNITYGFTGTKGNDVTQLENFCTNGGNGAFSGTLVSTNNGMVTCRLTFPAGSTASGTYSLFDSLGDYQSGQSTKTSLSLTAGGSTAQAPEATILAANVVGMRIGQRSDYTRVTINGKDYVRYPLWVNLIQPYPSAQYAKGEMGYVGFDVKVDATALPDGTLFTRNADANSAAVQLTETSAGSKVLTARRDRYGNTYPYAWNWQSQADAATYVNIPVDALPESGSTKWTVHISDGTTFPDSNSAPSTTFKDPLNGAGDPGMGQPSSYDTSVYYPTGYWYYTGYPNDNWTDISYAQQTPGLNLYKQFFEANSDGSYSDQYRSQYRPNDKFWASLNVNSSQSTDTNPGELSFCDSWSVSTGYVANNSNLAPQHYDASRSVQVVEGAPGSTQPLKVLASDRYDVSYGYAPAAGTGIGQCEAVTDWSNDPAAVNGGDPNVVRVTVHNGSLGRTSQDGNSYRVRVPFKTGPASEYPGWEDATKNIYAPDQYTLSKDNTQLGGSGQYQIKIGTYSGWSYGNISHRAQVKNGDSTSIVPVMYTGSTYTSTFNAQASWDATTPDDKPTAKVDLEVSSCAVDPVITAPAGVNVTLVSPPNLGPDGLPCTADDVSGWKYTATLSPTNVGARGASLYRSIVATYKVSPFAETGSEFLDKMTISPSHGPTTSWSNSTPIVSVRVSGQSKLADQSRVQVGDTAAWTSTFFNSMSRAGGAAAFIDVLPYAGDGRGTTATKPLSNVKVTPSTSIGADQVWVTSADPSTINRDATASSNDPANNSAWCKLSDSSCLGGKDITAYQVRLATFPDGFTGAVRVSGSTAGNTSGQTLVNNLGSGTVADLGIIPPTSNQPVGLFLSSLSGSVYRDSNVDGMRDNNEPSLPNYEVSLRDSSGQVIATTHTDAAGKYSFTELKSGTYSVKIADPTSPYTGVNQAYQTFKTDGTAGTSSGNIMVGAASDVTNVDFGLSVPKSELTLKKSGALTADQKSIDYSFTVTNTGQRQIDNISIDDGRLNNAGIAVKCDATTLAVGDSTTCRPASSYPVPSWEFQNATLTNYATARGTNSDGETITSATASAVVDLPDMKQGRISGFVYQDTDTNGQFSNGTEPVFNKYEVSLLDGSGNVIQTTTTNVQGSYAFTNLPKGNYYVKVADPAAPFTGLTQAYQIVEPDGSAGTKSDTIALQANQQVNWVNFGLLGPDSSLSLTKEGVLRSDASAIDYTFTVKNTGGQKIDNIAIDDWRFTNSGTTAACEVTSLDVGESTTCRGTYVLGADERDHQTNVVNYATATGVTTGGLSVRSNQASATVAMPDAKNGELGGTVYFDSASNGYQNYPQDPTIPSYSVSLLDAAGNVVGTTKTDDNGRYSFSSLAGGTYTVKIADPTSPYSGVTRAYQTIKTDGSAGTSSGPVTVPVNQSVYNVDFGLIKELRESLSITKSGTVTADETGVKYTFTITNTGERAITDVAIQDDILATDKITTSCAKTSLAAGESTTCSADAVYKFHGQDYVSRSAYNYAYATGKDPEGLTLTSDQANVRVDVPADPKTSRVSGTVYADSDGDGAQGSGESGVPTYQVTLLDRQSRVVGKTTTNAQGYYEFTNLPADYYTVKIADVSDPFTGITQAGRSVNAGGYGQTTAWVGDVAPDHPGDHVDFGLVTNTASVEGTVYGDTNDNGRWDAGEPTIANQEVALGDDLGHVFADVQTDANGHYIFKKVPAKNLRVVSMPPQSPYNGISQAYQIVDPSGKAGLTDPQFPGYPWTNIFAVKAGDAITNVDFGYKLPGATPPPSTISGTVYTDDDSNGSRASGEAGVATYDVTLVDKDGKDIASTKTDSNGAYQFTGLAAGNYRVRIAAVGSAYSGVTQAYQSVKTDGTAGTDSGQFALGVDSTVSGVDFGLKPLAPTPTTSGSSSSSSSSSSDSSSSSTDPSSSSSSSSTDSSSSSASSTSSTSSSSSDSSTDSSSSSTTSSTTSVVPGRIAGRVYADADDNGALGASESGVATYRVTLLDANDTEVAHLDTGGDGSYVFAGLAPGTYHVRIAVLTAPWTGVSQAYQVVKTDGSAGRDSGALEVTSGGSIADVNFGLLRPAATSSTTSVPTIPIPTGSTSGSPSGSSSSSTSTTSTTSTSTSKTPVPSDTSTPTATPTTSTSSSSSSRSSTSTKSNSASSSSSGAKAPHGTGGVSTATSTSSSTTSAQPGGGVSTASSTSSTKLPQASLPASGGKHKAGTVPTMGGMGQPSGTGQAGQDIVNTGEPGVGSNSMLPLMLGGVLLAGGLTLLGLVGWRRRRN